MVHRHRHRLTVTLDLVGSLRENVQVIEYFLRAELLEDTDTGVRNDDRQERQAPVGSRDNKKDRDHGKY